MKRIILCADDYGQNLPISQAIVNLFEKKRLTATSCLTTSPLWPVCSSQLLPYKNKVDLGLHFNLTEGSPLSPEFTEKYSAQFPSLPQLIGLAYRRRLDKEAVRAELSKQLERFISELGQLPDFIDGHQHIHQLPIVRDALLEIWNEQLKKQGTYIRCTDRTGRGMLKKHIAFIKRFIIQCCGARALKRRLVELSVPHNQSFEGIYDFVDYRGLFPLFLKQTGNGGLIMCHPGLEETDQTDSIQAARYREYCYFMSEQFTLDCEKEGVILARFENIC